MKDFLFIVPARGGSKRLPNKNLMKIGGISLLQWTDNAVKASDKDADISLTTDNLRIAEEGKKLGWNVPFIRPKNLSQDSSRTFDAVIHLLNWRKNNGLNSLKEYHLALIYYKLKINYMHNNKITFNLC